MQRSDFSPVAPWEGITDLTPATDAQFITILTPCLQLVAPVGMDIEAQDTWFEAARMALAGVPENLLRRGAKAAMAKADHPSKIVPIIMDDIREDWEWRKRHHGNPRVETREALPAPDYCSPEEATEICKRYGVGSFARSQPKRDAWKPKDVGHVADDKRPSKAPTREDYIRLFGIDPEAPKAATDEAA